MIKPDKPTENLEFDVIYADGTRKHVAEGILLSVHRDADREEIIFHNGTNRIVVLFSATDTLLKVISELGLVEMFEKYLDMEGGDDNAHPENHHGPGDGHGLAH